MKKGFKVLLIIACLLVIIGLVISIIAFGAGAMNSFGSYTAALSKSFGFVDDFIYDPPRDFDGTIAAEPGSDYMVSVDLENGESMDISPDTIRAVKIEWIAGDVIITGGAPEFLIEESGNSEHKTVCTLKKGVLHIKYMENMGGTSFGSFTESKDIAIRLPSSVSERLNYISVSGASSDLDFANLTAGKIKTDTASGKCVIFAVNADEFEANTASGAIDIHGTFGSADCDTASGKITAEGTFGEFSANTASGGISASGTFNELDAGSASGKVELYLENCPYEVDVSTASGSVDITVPYDSSLTLEFDSGSGKLISDYASGKGRHVIGSPGSKSEFEIETASGNLHFNMN